MQQIAQNKSNHKTIEICTTPQIGRTLTPAENIHIGSQTITADGMSLNAKLIGISADTKITLAGAEHVFALKADAIINNGLITYEGDTPGSFALVTATGTLMQISGHGTITTDTPFHITTDLSLDFSQKQVNGLIDATAGNNLTLHTDTGPLVVGILVATNGNISLSTSGTQIHLSSQTDSDNNSVASSVTTTANGSILISAPEGQVNIDALSTIRSGIFGGGQITITSGPLPKKVLTTPIPLTVSLTGNAANGQNVFIGKNGVDFLGSATLNISGTSSIIMNASTPSGIQIGDKTAISSGVIPIAFVSQTTDSKISGLLDRLRLHKRNGTILEMTDLNSITLEQGEIFVDPNLDGAKILCGNVAFTVPNGVMATIERYTSTIAIRNLGSTNCMPILLPKFGVSIFPGQELLISPFNVNPCVALPNVRNVRTFKNGRDELWVSEFSVLSAVQSSTLLRTFAKEKDPENRKLVNKILKSAVSLSLATSSHGPYSVHPLKSRQVTTRI